MPACILGCATGYATGCPPMASAAQRAASLFPNLMMPAWILPSVTSSTRSFGIGSPGNHNCEHQCAYTRTWAGILGQAWG